MKELALKLNGSTSYTDIPNFNLNSNYTIEFAIKPYKLEGIIINNENSFAIGFDTKSRLILHSISKRYSTIKNIKINEWNYVSITYDENSVPSVFINGKEEEYTTYQSWNNTGNFIGKRKSGTFYNGEIDEVRIWNKILDKSEMLSFNQKQVSNTTEGLIAKYTFDDGTENKITNVITNEQTISYNCGYVDGIDIGYYKFLLKQNNQYYSIKPEYYSNGQFQPLTLEGGTTPNENDYENFGFNDINGLLVSQNSKVIQGTDNGSLGKGKYFEVELDNEMKKINNIEMAKTIFDFSTSKGITKLNDFTITISSRNSFIRTNTFKEIKGKYVFETKIIKKSGGGSIGICSDEIVNNYPGYSSTGYSQNIHESAFLNDGQIVNNAKNWDVKDGDVIGFCIDLDNKSMSIHLNGVLNYTHDIPNINKKCYIAVGSGYGYGSTVELITSNLIHQYPVEYETWGAVNKFLIEQNNQYYTFNNSEIILSPSQELNQDNFMTNGFYNIFDITEQQWNDAFPDKTDLKLLMWTDDLDKTEIKAECEIEPFTPYDKLNDEFEICMATDKETTV